MSSDSLVDARARFRPKALNYVVQIKVDVSLAFLWAVLRCIFTRKKLRITHVFTNDPFVSEVKGHAEPGERDERC